jgi:hypothetical protein
LPLTSNPFPFILSHRVSNSTWQNPLEITSSDSEATLSVEFIMQAPAYQPANKVAGVSLLGNRGGCFPVSNAIEDTLSPPYHFLCRDF